MTVTFAFDVFGTLIDTGGVFSALQRMAGHKADELARLWRDKQLEYSFRRGLMQRYEDFGVCTRQALEFALTACSVPLTDRQKQELLEGYRDLPAYADVTDGLSRVHSRGHRLFAFSNGTRSAVEGLLVNAGIREFFLDIVSVDEVRSFKPDPAAYRHFLARADSRAGDCWLVSGNPFDVIGAVSAGLNAAWVRRDPAAVFDPWEFNPTITVGGLAELHEAVSGQLKA